MAKYLLHGFLHCKIIGVVVIEVWEGIEAHQAAAQRIPVHAFEQVMGLLDGSPSGEYYS